MVAVVGLGKMGLSHLSMLGAHPDVDLVGVCDSTSYVLDVLGKYTGTADVRRLRPMLDAGRARRGRHRDAVEPRTRTWCARRSSEGIHVFCEKPLCLDPAESAALADLAAETRAGDAGRLPQPVRRGVRRGQAAARPGRHRHGDARARRGVRTGRAQAQGQHVAQPARSRAAAASTTTPPTRSTC